MKKPQSPCLNCAERQTGCHAICGRYRDFKADMESYTGQVSAAIGGSRRITYNKRRQTKIWGIK